MNRKQIQDAYQMMTPDGSAKQRMLERILEQGGYQVNREYYARPHRNGGWKGIVAAVLALTVLIGGMVTMLQGRTPDQTLNDLTGETTVPVNPHAMEVFMDTDFYKAAVEYNDYRLLFSGQPGNSREKMAEIADQYGLLTYNGDDSGTDDYAYFLEETSLESFIHEDGENVTVDIGSCWWYDQSRFNVAGTVTFEGDNSVRVTPLDFNFYRTTPDYLLSACCEMGRLENYETWLYPLSSGDTAILAMGGNRSYVIAYVIVCRGEEIIFVEVTNWLALDSDPPMTREALEAFADLFRYEMIVKTKSQTTELPAAYQEVLLQYHRAYQEGWSEEQVQNAGLSQLIFWEPNMYQVGYQLKDIDGNGNFELIIGNGTWIFDIFKLTEDGIRQVATGHPTMMVNLCKQNVIEVQLSCRGNARRYDYYSYFDGELVLLESMMYDPDRDDTTDWFRVDVEDTDILHPVTKDEFGSVLASYQRIDLQLEPLDANP